MSRVRHTQYLPGPIQNMQAHLARPGTAIGMAPQRPSGNIAQPSSPVGAPVADPAIDRITEIYTYITEAVTDGIARVLYNGDRQWAQITLVLESAGPVVVGTRQNLAPVLSGAGKLLQTNEPYQITIAKSSRLYILSTSVNRVSVTIQPPAWLEQITAAAQKIAQQ